MNFSTKSLDKFFISVLFQSLTQTWRIFFCFIGIAEEKIANCVIFLGIAEEKIANYYSWLEIAEEKIANFGQIRNL